MKKFYLFLAFTAILAVTLSLAITSVSSQSAKKVKYTCTDSDSGINAFKAGVVTGTDEKGEYGITDKCIMNKITEYYCKNGKALKKVANCATGCEQEGIFVGEKYHLADKCKSMCEDSDGGVNLKAKGTVTTPFTQASDFCIDEMNVLELSCGRKGEGWISSASSDYARIVAKTLKCGKKEYCRNGACVEKTEASDFLIERSFGNLAYVASEVHDGCNIVHTGGNCKIYVGRYGEKYEEGAIAGVETHTEQFSNFMAVESILREFARGDVSVSNEIISGNNVMVIKSKTDYSSNTMTILSWYSGDKIVALIWYVNAEENFREMIEEYLKKYPSDLKPLQPENLCIDTDWTNQYSTGSVIDNFGQYKDACIVPATNPENGWYAEINGQKFDFAQECSGADCFVAEATCNNKINKFEKLACEYEGFVCKGGRCVNNLAEGECIDTDSDEEDAYSVRGAAYAQGYSMPNFDFCLNENLLYEQSCKTSEWGTYVSQEEFDCSSVGKICSYSLGACVEMNLNSSS